MFNKLRNYLSVIIMLLIAVTVGILTLTGVLDADRMIRSARDNKSLALLLILALYIIKGCSMLLPELAICVGTALVFDIGTALIITYIGTAICISISYFIGRLSKQLTFEDYLEKKPKLKKYFSNAQSYSFTFCFAVHTSHLSMEAQGVLFGLLRTPYLSYLGGSMLALLPNISYYTILGDGFDLNNPLFWIFVGLDALMVAAGLFYGKRHIIDGRKDL